jgi:hypothetical protein
MDQTQATHSGRGWSCFMGTTAENSFNFKGLGIMSAKRKPFVGKRIATTVTTPNAQVKFLEGLARGLSVTGAAQLAGACRQSVYVWRRADPAFAEAWDAAVESGTDLLEDEVLRRALEGTQEPAISMGKVVFQDGAPLLIRKYADGLAQFLLRGRRREKFSDRVDQSIKLEATVQTADDQRTARDIVSERLAQLAERVSHSEPLTALLLKATPVSEDGEP